MPQIDPNQPGHFCWMELMTPDRAQAKAFYAEIAGWESVDQEMSGQCESSPEPMNFTYTMCGVPGVNAKVAGMMQMDGPQFANIPPHWMPYISVADVDAKAAQAKELGAEVVVPPTDIPNVGRFTLLKDPTGAMISLITLKG